MSAADDSLREAERKEELRAFLMSRRARLQPEDFGFPRTGRRRTPGLRREEVAQLAGVSAAWYTLFETAGEHRVSDATVESIALALQLTSAEKQHLQHLARGGAGDAATHRQPISLDASLITIADGYQGGPALVHDTRFDVHYTNAIADRLLGSFDGIGTAADNNLLLRLVRDHDLRSKIAEPDAIVRQLAAAFRTAYCADADGADDALLQALLASSPTFATVWHSHDVVAIEAARSWSIVYRGAWLQFELQTLFPKPSLESKHFCCFFVPAYETRETAEYRELLAESLRP